VKAFDTIGFGWRAISSESTKAHWETLRMKWPSWLKLVRARKPSSPTACPTCGKQMVFVEKYTMMGDDLRTYRCDRCRKEHTIDFGIAMWKWMSDANKPDS
jgi:transposase-like protein